MEQAALCGFKNTPSRSCGCLQAVVSLHQSQKSEGACCNSRSRRDILTKIDCADGALESMSIRIILFVCCNPDKPHQGAARRTDRSFYRPFWKRNRAERRHGRPRSLGCAGRMPGMLPTRRRQRPGVRLQRPAQGKMREAPIVPWAQKGRVLRQLLSGQLSGVAPAY
jgi:hypothetical protein